jgi:hypothetical protein
MEILSTSWIGRGGNQPLRQPNQIGIRIFRGGWSEAQVVQLHHDLVTRIGGRAWRRSDLGDARANDIELGHVRAAHPVYFILSIAGWIRHRVERRQSRNVQRRAGDQQSVAAVLPDKRSVRSKGFVDIVRIGVSDLRFTEGPHAELQEIA